jgi:protein ImuB
VARPARLAFRVYRPALAAAVSAPCGQPVQVAAGPVRGRVVTLAGPWRTSGNWWHRDAWTRDEWDVSLNDGGLYRLCCDAATGCWHVEGSYD